MDDKTQVLTDILEELKEAGLDPAKYEERLKSLLAADEAVEDETEEETVTEDGDEEIEKPAEDEEPELVEEEAEEEVEAEDADDEEDQKALIEDALKACGYDSEDPALQKAFAEGVKYGETKEKEEPEKLDREHESEGEKKALGEDSAKIVKTVLKSLQKNLNDRFCAAKAVERSLGKVNALAYDNAGAIYRDALKQEGISARGLTDSECRAAYRAAMSVKNKTARRAIAQDSAPAKSDSAISSVLNKVNLGV